MGLSEIEGEYKMIAIYGKNSEEWMISDMAG
jgi:long-subunit acyl-CoA synthetase (AMP-forming)